MTEKPQQPRVLIIGAGFGGLFAARALANKPVDVLLIDRQNYHTFTPLLYQVATCALDPSEIAYPVRSIFRKNANVEFLLGEVIAIDAARRQVTVRAAGDEHEEPFDYLILAAGSTPTYFGQDDFRAHALELRTLTDAITLRNHILELFERATWTDDEELRQALTTIVVVGGGPTGLETAGAIYELFNHVLDVEYPQKSLRARVILVEMQPHLLAPYPPDLQRAAAKQLRSLGVEVILGQPVVEVAADYVRLEDGRRFATHTLVWTAGVKGPAAAHLLDTELTGGGRVPVEPTLEAPGQPGIYAVGDMAYLEGPDGEPYAMVIPVAQQQGERAARNILADIEGRPQEAFSYYDRGVMATIGRSRAVAYLYNRVQLQGYLAWLAWLALHLVTLLGFRNRLVVFITWVWNYITYTRSVRIIYAQTPLGGDDKT